MQHLWQSTERYQQEKLPHLDAEAPAGVAYKLAA
jgi:hypothetical protein